MRMERRRLSSDDNNFKRVLYITGGILSLSVIAFIAIFILYGGKKEQSQLAKFNTSFADDYQTNNFEETSSQMGKTVNEMENEVTNTVENNITNNLKNEVENNVSNEVIKDTDSTKYAVNTSKSEEIANEIKEDKKNNEKKDEDKPKDPEFKIPVEGEILRKYAKENLVYSTTLDEWITHNGIDIKAEKTTVVKASAEGTVKSIKNDPRYGLTITIEHTNGFSSVYSNLLTAEFVEEGEKVKQGQTIGTVGNTATFEIADESHLHFEILKDDVSVDPELYLS